MAHTQEPAEDHGEHDIWEHMTPEMRKDLRADDRQAWKDVVGVLITIVTIGLLMGILTVLISGAW